jgi:hypothetical protein
VSDAEKAVLRARRRRLIKRINALEMETLRLFRPLPAAAPFHASRKPITVFDGSNRSGKTLHTIVELARAVSGCDPYGKYPKNNGHALVVGYDEDHLANPIWQKLTQPGEIKLIQDEHTRQWRAVRADPNDPKHLDPYDLAYREKWKDAPPILPPRIIKGRPAMKAMGRGVPAVVECITGWRILFRTSKGEPPQGITLNFALFDEELFHSDKWLNEIIPRLNEINAKLVWGATPLTGGRALYELRERADSNDPDVDRYTLLIDDNPHISDERKAIIFRGLTDDAERDVRYFGKYRLLGRLVYPTYDPMGIHGCEPFEIPANWCRYCVLDPGTQNLGCLFIAIDPQETHAWVYHGFQLQKADSAQWAFEVRRRNAQTGGNQFQAIIIDKRAGKQHPFGANLEGLNVAQQYWDAVVMAGIEPVQQGPLAGFFPGSDDIDARETGLRTWMTIRGAGPEPGTPVVQVFRGVVPELDKQIKYAETGENGKRVKLKAREENLVECLEYAAMFNPRYHTPPQTPNRPEAADPIDEFYKWKRRLAAKRQKKKRGHRFASTIAIG